MMSTISGSRDNQPSACVFDIAGQRLTVVTDDRVLARLIRQRYSAFATDAGPGLVVRVRTSSQASELDGATEQPASHGTPSAERTAFLAGVLLHTAPGCAGRVDLVSHTHCLVRDPVPRPPGQAQGPAPTCSDGASHAAELRLGRDFSLESVDYFLRLVVALALFDAGGLLLHAAGVVQGGRAYVFLGPSGSGKTTVARLSPPGSVLNDDLVALVPAGGGWRVHATPFSNPTQVAPSGPRSAPLARMVRLTQSPDVFEAPIDAATAVAEIAASIPVIGLDPGRAPLLLARAGAIARATDVARLHFRPDPSFWPLIAPAAAEVMA